MIWSFGRSKKMISHTVSVNKEFIISKSGNIGPGRFYFFAISVSYLKSKEYTIMDYCISGIRTVHSCPCKILLQEVIFRQVCCQSIWLTSYHPGKCSFKFCRRTFMCLPVTIPDYNLPEILTVRCEIIRQILMLNCFILILFFPESHISGLSFFRFSEDEMTQLSCKQSASGFFHLMILSMKILDVTIQY